MNIGSDIVIDCMVTGGGFICGEHNIEYRDVVSLCYILETNIMCQLYSIKNLFFNVDLFIL